MILLEVDLSWDTAIDIGVTLLLAVVAYVVVRVALAQMVKRVQKKYDARTGTPDGGNGASRAVQRTKAVAALCQSIWTIVLVVMVVLTILSAFGIPLAPLLTSAGVGGVVIGIGAQSLVKDYLSGIFMVLEDQYGVGDQIKVGDITGTVEDVSLRVTRLRDPGGLIWYIRNGEIVRLGNVSQGYSTGLVDIPVAYDADITKVTEVLQAVLEQVQADPALAGHLLEAPQLLGVESVSATTMTLRISCKTPPNEQYDLVRDIRERAMAALGEAGIPAPSVVPGWSDRT